MRLVVAVLVLLAATGARAAANLEATERVHDAGKIDRGVKLRHDFVLKNVGTTELSIDAKPG